MASATIACQGFCTAASAQLPCIGLEARSHPYGMPSLSSALPSHRLGLLEGQSQSFAPRWRKRSRRNNSVHASSSSSPTDAADGSMPAVAALSLPFGKQGLAVVPAEPQTQTHTVQRGQVMSKIAKLYNTDLKTLHELNPGVALDYVRPKQTIVVPIVKEGAGAASGAAPMCPPKGSAPPSKPQAQSSWLTPPPPQSKAPPAKPRAETVAPPEAAIPAQQIVDGTLQYVVKPGDSLFTIAEKFGVSMTELVKLNKLHFKSTIRPTQVLKVPANSRPQAAVVASVCPAPAPTCPPSYKKPQTNWTAGLGVALLLAAGAVCAVAFTKGKKSSEKGGEPQPPVTPVQAVTDIAVAPIVADEAKYLRAPEPSSILAAPASTQSAIPVTKPEEAAILVLLGAAATAVTLPEVAANPVIGPEVAATPVTQQEVTATSATSPEVAADPLTVPEAAATPVAQPEVAANSVIQPEVVADPVTQSVTATSVTEPEAAANPVTQPEGTATAPVTQPEVAVTASVTEPEAAASKVSVDAPEQVATTVAQQDAATQDQNAATQQGAEAQQAVVIQQDAMTQQDAAPVSPDSPETSAIVEANSQQAVTQSPSPPTTTPAEAVSEKGAASTASPETTAPVEAVAASPLPAQMAPQSEVTPAITPPSSPAQEAPLLELDTAPGIPAQAELTPAVTPAQESPKTETDSAPVVATPPEATGVISKERANADALIAGQAPLAAAVDEPVEATTAAALPVDSTGSLWVEATKFPSLEAEAQQPEEKLNAKAPAVEVVSDTVESAVSNPVEQVVGASANTTALALVKGEGSQNGVASAAVESVAVSDGAGNGGAVPVGILSDEVLTLEPVDAVGKQMETSNGYLGVGSSFSRESTITRALQNSYRAASQALGPMHQTLAFVALSSGRIGLASQEYTWGSTAEAVVALRTTLPADCNLQGICTWGVNEQANGGGGEEKEWAAVMLFSARDRVVSCGSTITTGSARLAAEMAAEGLAAKAVGKKLKAVILVSSFQADRAAVDVVREVIPGLPVYAISESKAPDDSNRPVSFAKEWQVAPSGAISAVAPGISLIGVTTDADFGGAFLATVVGQWLYGPKCTIEALPPVHKKEMATSGR